MTRSLEGKLAIVSGASRGIGAAVATSLASKGANVVINFTSDSSESLASSLASSLQADHGIHATTVRADIGTPEGAAKVVAAAGDLAASSAGPERFQIDILVNNAGIALVAPLADVTTDQFHETYRVNVLGPLLLTQACLPHLPRDRSGRVVNVGSVSSAAGFVMQTVYGGSKAALDAMTRTWARELAERATVNAINPGPVEGPMYAAAPPAFLDGIRGWIAHTPLMAPRPDLHGPATADEAREYGGRLARTPEIAGIVAMLCSEDAQWCTGQVVCANGGMLMLQ